MKMCICIFNFIFCLQAMDLWMAGCMVFVFAALGEFVVVKVLLVRHELAKADKMPPPKIPKIIPLVSS